MRATRAKGPSTSKGGGGTVIPSEGALYDFNVSNGLGAWNPMDGTGLPHFRFDAGTGKLIYTGGSGIESNILHATSHVDITGTTPFIQLDDGVTSIIRITNESGEARLTGADDLNLDSAGLIVGANRLTVAGLDGVQAVAGKLLAFKDVSGVVEMVDAPTITPPLLNETIAIGSGDTGAIDISLYKFVSIKVAGFFSSAGTAHVELNNITSASYMNTWDKTSDQSSNVTRGDAFENSIPIIRDEANDAGTMRSGGGVADIYTLKSSDNSKAHILNSGQSFITDAEIASITTVTEFLGQENTEITSIKVKWTNIQNTSSILITGLLR